MAGAITLSESDNYTRIDWKINNFFVREDRFIKSPNFTLFNLKWYLRIENDEFCPLLNPWTGIRSRVFFRMSLLPISIKDEQHIECRMGIIRNNGIEARTQKFETTLHSGLQELQGRQISSILDFKSFRDTPVSGDTLRVFCTVRRVSDSAPSPYGAAVFTECSTGFDRLTSNVSTSDQTHKHFSERHFSSEDTSTLKEVSSDLCETAVVSTLCENFKDLYRSQRCTDVTIKVKNKEFRAHKLILSTRSDVFSSMFEHDTLEKESGVIEIPDCDPESFDDFLLCLYTGKSNMVSSNNAVSLFVTAHKYNLPELHEECVRCMIREINVDSFCEIFHLAAFYDKSDLLSSATKFFINNASAILTSKKWLTLLDEQATLCNELLVKFAKGGQQK